MASPGLRAYKKPLLEENPPLLKYGPRPPAKNTITVDSSGADLGAEDCHDLFISGEKGVEVSQKPMEIGNHHGLEAEVRLAGSVHRGSK